MNSDILICIFNYRCDENAKRWKKLLSPHFETVVLDSGNDHEEKDFVQFPNIYYSGLFNEMKKMSEKQNYKFVGIITSDVEIDDENGKKLIDRLNWLTTTSNIGQYQASLDNTSRGYKQHEHLKNGMHAVRFIEGMFTIMNRVIIDKMPFIDVNVNKYGMYIDNVFSALCIRNNLYNIYDTTCTIHHPDSCGYQKDDRNTYIKWCNNLKMELLHVNNISENNKELNFVEISNPTIYYSDKIVYKDYVTDKIIYTGDKEKPVFVTLTTWKKRLPYIEQCINNLTKQDYNVDKYILWLSSDEISKNEIPNDIIKNNKIEIHWVDKNLKSFKKFLTIQQYPNAYNIIFDDDRLYESHIVSDLMGFANKNGSADIIDYYSDICNTKGQPWGGIQGNDKSRYRWVNDSCILYKPNTFPLEIFDDFYRVMKDEPLVSDECLIMPYLIYHKKNIVPIVNDISGLDRVAKRMSCAENSDALHCMFFKTPGRVIDNKKNSLIVRILNKLSVDIQKSYKQAFPNSEIYG